MNIEELFEENEIKANHFATYFVLFTACGFIAAWVFKEYLLLNYSLENPFLNCLCSAALLFFSALFSILSHYESKLIKYIFNIIFIFIAIINTIFTANQLWISFLFPVVISIRYYDESFLFKISICALILMIFTQAFALYYGYLYGNIDINLIENITDGTTITVNNGLTNTLITNGLITYGDLTRYFISFSLKNVFVFFLFIYSAFSICKNGRLLIIQTFNESELRRIADKRADQAQTNIMISQIQPHFLYNSLTAIMAIDGNPNATVEAIGNFGKYLRGNLNILKNGGPIPFSNELEHIKNYLYLEKLRFNDLLNIQMDIECLDFKLPPLSVQMLIENGIKHGISKRKKGGLLIIKTYEDDLYYNIMVEDNGPGFDYDKIMNEENDHVGLKSCVYRLTSFGALIDIDSKINVGTKCHIRIRKG